MMKLDELKDESKYQTAPEKRKRGYEFETYLFDSFESQDILINRPYKKPGEQIDGGIYFDGSWYLIEAKWHAKKLPVSEVYAFKGKVDGKLAGTKGFFISWSGYSEECADALSLGKELNIILCDSSDVEAASKLGWGNVLRQKLMFASLYGQVFAPSNLLETIGLRDKTTAKYEIFVEGNTDVEILSMLLEEIGIEKDIYFTPCSGKLSAIRMASSLPNMLAAKRILVLDSDGNPNLEDEYSNLPMVDDVLVIEPQIEALFFPKSDEPYKELKLRAREEKVPLKYIILSMLKQVVRDDPQQFVSRLLCALDEKSANK